MENVLVIDVSDKELQQLHSDVRPEWPENGMHCQIPKCHSGHFNTLRQYMRHYKQTHVPNVVLFQCMCCNSKLNSKQLLKLHLKTRHNVLVNKLEGLLNSVEKVKIPNAKYIDPQGCKPPKAKVQKVRSDLNE